ncbi:4-hydroxyphenylacetate 3-hydroxylase C-terminal domain-containing protein [Streptomyces sp. NPDC092046]|uniref:4-hydroxyphenylacetate 3-hydroxylase C-terminal domain-containing protein n=1 Tax=Streptomyces sp. NPDC092046 TaxID=3366009 RepID=UPI00382BF85E
MTRSGQEYPAALRDGREVWLDGERVADVTAHPAFRSAAASSARLHELAADPALRPGQGIPFAQRITAGEPYPRVVQGIKLLAGGALIQLPASDRALHPELGALVHRWFRTPGEPSEDRIKLLELAWDGPGSEFACRHRQYERFHQGAPHVYLTMRTRAGAADACEAPARACLDGYDLGTSR